MKAIVQNHVSYLSLPSFGGAVGGYLPLPCLPARLKRNGQAGRFGGPGGGFLFFVLLFISNLASAQTVNIPDQNFKNALLNHSPAIDTNNDGEIQLTEAQTATSVDVSGKSIQDLTGIESFVNITSLNCSNNQLATLNLSQNI